MNDSPPLRVMALHALLYCERLFYLEEVEEIRVANDRVYAGRQLHAERLPLDDETPEIRELDVASEEWGIYGKLDAVRRRDGNWVVYEHKKGRSNLDDNKRPLPWPSDRIQLIAYAVLASESLGEPISQGRIRYHANNKTAFVEIDEIARQDLIDAVNRAQALRKKTTRPPVTENDRLCVKCSLAPVCLPEEERLQEPDENRIAIPLPSNRERHTLHVAARKAYVSRSSASLLVKLEDEKQKVPVSQVDSIVIHGHAQITTQALHLCAYKNIPIHWISYGGKFLAGTTYSAGRVQQRIRQFEALTDHEMCVSLSRILLHAKIEMQLKYLLRATRNNQTARTNCEQNIAHIRECLRKLAQAESLETMRGLEGIAAKSYFASIPQILSSRVPQSLLPHGRSKHPPRDPFNSLLSFGYSMLFNAVHRSIITVGLDPAFGFLHQPRSAAPPLVMDLMELFRVLLVDMPLVGSFNRGQWSEDDFKRTKSHVWLTDEGRKKAISLFESRMDETSQHPHTGRAMTYIRLVELEARLLEKEWTGTAGLFGQLRIR
ncbi:type I-MYXAN CRISPR-associated endonuclease Cas4/Cas1 [Thalassoglobus polymorphus]|uniref:CRISPR-associated endonuclease Cas1 n=1 Tax=Thalassoglobus polymorphus TaxID=2527994 RepID=A0A517QKY4_9PLAN|nr:type I-MYXAN CRISPR-associated endonuclease Cas1 [Thalassoglobus polymorphus]QDT32302.1 CRISPR-associated protein Cas4/endonuclease Cas1 fusion [Thalassoglobus polymorphus]